MYEHEIVVLNEQQEQNISLQNEQVENAVPVTTEALSIYVNHDYEGLENKPKINSVTLIGDKSSNDLHLQEEGDYANERITNSELEAIFNW